MCAQAYSMPSKKRLLPLVAAAAFGVSADLHAQEPVVATVAEQATEPSTDSTTELDTIAVGAEAAPEPLSSAAPVRGGGLGIEEVVVTAQRRAEAINDIPISITAFSGDTLAALGVTDTRDLGNVTPGFTAADSGYNTPVYTLRGIGFNDTTYTATSTVGVYVDETPLPYSIMTKGANLDVERVEILKGPQGILYGRNTTGGAINYIARKPTDTFEYGLTGTYSSFETTEIEGYASGPLTDDLKGRIAVKDLRSQEGWQRSLTRPDDRLGKKDKQSFRGILEWTPDADLFFRLSADGWSDRSDAQAPQAIFINPQNPIVPNTPAAVGQVLDVLQNLTTPVPGVGALVQTLNNRLGNNVILAPQVANHPTVDQNTDDMRVADWAPQHRWMLDDNYWNVALRNEWTLDDSTTLTSIASYAQVASDGSSLPQSGLSVYNSEQIITAGINTTSLESRLAGQWGDGNNWLLGVNAAFDDGNESHYIFTDTQSALFPDPITGQALLASRITVAGSTRARTLGIFANGDWRFADTLKLTLGMRYSDEARKFHGCSREGPDSQGIGLELLFNALAATKGNLSFPVKDGECLTLDENGNNDEFHGKLDEDNLSGRAVLDWTPINHYLFYASYARGFKSGGFPVTNSSDQIQYTPVTQERLDAFEIGSKTALIPRVLQVNTAAFYYDYTDKQLLTRFADPIFGPLPILRNAPKSTVQGVELDLQLTPIQGLFISGAASYIDTRIDEFVSTTISGEENHDFSGRPFNFAPRFQYSVLADYSFQIGARLNLGIGADYSYMSKTNSTLEGDPRYAHRAYGLTNVRLRLTTTDGHWSAMLFARNVFDEFSQISVFQLGDAIVRYAGEPRTVGLTISYNGF